MEKVAKIETVFLKAHMNMKCKCKYDIHIKCYNNWRLYTPMICPICRITDIGIKNNPTNINNCALYCIIFIFYVWSIIFLFRFGNNPLPPSPLRNSIYPPIGMY
jgi:hypothetical protein